MQYSGMYLLREDSELEYVRNCILVVIGNPNICCVQKLYNYNGSIYKYRVNGIVIIGIIGEPYLGYKKRMVRYKPVPPDPDMHNAMCSAKVINI